MIWWLVIVIEWSRADCRLSCLPSPAASHLLATSLGDIVTDFEIEACPKICENFLRSCKVYYCACLDGLFARRAHCYLRFMSQMTFFSKAETPTATGTSGESIW
jgi:peptidyl-prolyl cis-trans isomerase-like 4